MCVPLSTRLVPAEDREEHRTQDVDARGVGCPEVEHWLQEVTLRHPQGVKLCWSHTASLATSISQDRHIGLSASCYWWWFVAIVLISPDRDSNGEAAGWVFLWYSFGPFQLVIEHVWDFNSVGLLHLSADDAHGEHQAGIGPH